MLRSVQVAGLFGGLLMMGISACNLGATATADIPETIDDSAPVVTVIPTQTITPTTIITPQATFTLTPLPTVPPSQTPIVSNGDNNGVAPVGSRGEATTAPVQDGQPTPTAEIVFPTTFPDRHTTIISAGRTLLVTYLVQLENPGQAQVFFVLNDPNGQELERWYASESMEETLEIEVETSGEHEILVGFNRLSGFYSVNFSFR